MKLLILLTSVFSFLAGCAGSTRSSDAGSKGDSYDDAIIEYYDGSNFRRMVYEGEIDHIIGEYYGGTIVMKSGVRYDYTRINHWIIQRVNERYRKAAAIIKDSASTR